MCDGIVKALTNAHHAPELKKNLVFVGPWIQKVFLVGLNMELCKSKGKGKFMVM